MKKYIQDTAMRNIFNLYDLYLSNKHIFNLYDLYLSNKQVWKS